MPRMKSNKRYKRKIVTYGKSYPLKDSWLYNIRTKNSLCAKLETNIETINTLSDDGANYQTFFLQQADKKREIQAPKFELDKIHSRIASLLARIEVPDYLHSGIKGRSNITNAHLGTTPVLTLDIKNFYSSTSAKSVYHFFYSRLNCSSDVASLLASLCTYNNHVPTGSRVSMILAYWANEPMFQHLRHLSARKNITMTVYVDDLTFSGENVNRSFQKNVINIIKRAGMSVHQKKTKLYLKTQAKVITGVVITDNKMFVRNKHHRAIYELFNSIGDAKNEAELEYLSSSLIGKLSAAGQIDHRFLQRARSMRQIYQSNTNQHIQCKIKT
ncbi:MAG: reverse transcriptase family protein [Legionella sp.]|uniref:reverse transcriptase family protein n=1 Tax=Legionella sp. TaxID=459 RepID=UPI0039E60E85